MIESGIILLLIIVFLTPLIYSTILSFKASYKFGIAAVLLNASGITIFILGLKQIINQSIAVAIMILLIGIKMRMNKIRNEKIKNNQGDD